MNKNLLVLYADDQEEIAAEFIHFATANDYSLVLRHASEGIADLDNFTDIVMIGCYYQSDVIEQIYLKNINILMIDTFKDTHPLLPLNVSKEGIPFVDCKGKWAILTNSPLDYLTTVRSLLSND